MLYNLVIPVFTGMTWLDALGHDGIVLAVLTMPENKLGNEPGNDIKTSVLSRATPE